MDKKGFTLIELLVTIGIVMTLAAFAIPMYLGQQKRAARTEAYTNLEALRALQEQYYAEHAEYAPDEAATGTLAGASAIRAVLPGFKPGSDDSLQFTYSINYTVNAGVTTAFTAHAVGKTGTRVAGDDFWVDNNNSKNF